MTNLHKLLRLFSTPGRPHGGNLLFWCAFVLLGALVLRPHGDTFTALDHSGYRMMAYAFTEGRGLHEVDHVLAEAPEDVRHALMLLPHMNERNTRDRSFLTAHLNNPVTEPFFYPLLPWLAAGLERWLPGIGLDLVVPLFGLLFCAVLLGVGFRAGGGWGLLVAVTMLLGAPWPLWLFRGFYVEAAAAACLAVSVAIYYRAGQTIWSGLLAGMLAGCSVSFHPVFIVPALPVAALLALDPRRRWSGSLAVLAGFALGLSVLLGMTEWVCRPYGDFSISTMSNNFRASASHRLPVIFGLVTAALLAVGLATRPYWQSRGAHLLCDGRVRLFLIALAVVPLMYAANFWRYDHLVRHGLLEAWSGIRLPLGLLVAGGVTGVIFSKRHNRAFTLLLVFFMTLPVFAYLKGAEQMGMWSQRRLMPAYTFLIFAVTPWLSFAFVRLMAITPAGKKALTGGALVVVLGFAALANPVRWPAPYLTRVEKGALSLVRAVKADIGDRFVMFDYHPFSFPFAVDNRTRVAGLGQGSREVLDKVADWVAEKAKREEVWWASAYANPGLEDGILLETIGLHTARLARVVAKGALPAEEGAFDIRLSLLRALPLQVSAGPVVMDKIMDGGPLGLREPWGNYRRTLKDGKGQAVPAEWSRQHSGVVGPVPSAGQWVTISIWGQSGQDEAQEILVRPPWGEDATKLLVQPAFDVYRVTMQRSPSAPVSEPMQTGVYRLDVPAPYDPAREGIRGFAHDLGVLVHRIRIETLPAAK